MRRMFALIAVLMAIPTTGGLAAQRPIQQRHAYVGVTTASGEAVPGLAVKDVVVREDNVAREVVAVTPACSRRAWCCSSTMPSSGQS